MDEWTLAFTSFDPEKEGVREALCTLGNGYLAIRGASEQSEEDGIHYPGTYLAGGYNRLKTEIEGITIENEDFVNFPNCLTIHFKIEDSPWFRIQDAEILSYEEALDIKAGSLSRKLVFIDGKKRKTSLATRRFVSMADPHLLAIEMRLVPENWEGWLEIKCALDGCVDNSGVQRYRQLNHKHLEAIESNAFHEEAIYLQVRTCQSHIHMAQSARMQLLVDGKSPRGLKQEVEEQECYIAKNYRIALKKEETLRLEKCIAVYTSKDRAISECGLQARKAIMRAQPLDSLFKEHQRAWKHLWKRFDIQIEYEGEKERIARLLHLHIFHLLQTISMHSMDLDVGVPPRGLHGEAYRGHILWDELFVFSTLNLQFPELTRSLLMYRYRRLPAAKHAAKEAGFAGAMFPWQSGSTGREESQKIHLNPVSGRWIPDNSQLQRHVNAAIAYNVWQHFEATDDLEFLSYYGAPLILEIARFWSSISSYRPESDRYEIKGVMGPDEYHDAYPDAEEPGLNNNAYTNVMASWVLSRALQLLDLIPKDRKNELEETLQLSEQELKVWESVRKKMHIPFHSDGVISQFEGYEDLEELDWNHYRKKYGDIQRLDRILEAEGDSTNRYKASKQADALMLFYLFSAEELRSIFEELGYSLEKETITKTVDYYLSRTSHGSTLSRIVHSWVLARSDRKVSWKFFCEGLESDVADIQGGTTSEGIHLGAMAGTIDILQRCYSGLEFRGDVLRFNPRLPDELKKMQTVIHYRGHSLFIQITHQKLRVRSERVAAKPIQIAYLDEIHPLEEGQVKEFRICHFSS